MNIGERIKAERIAREMSQDELAKKCGFKNRSSIYLIENGKAETPHKHIEAIANALHVSPEYLMGWVEKEDADKNDVIAELALKAQHSPEVFEIARKLNALSVKQLALVDIFLNTLVDDSVD